MESTQQCHTAWVWHGWICSCLWSCAYSWIGVSAAYLSANKNLGVVGKLTIQSIFSIYTSLSNIRKNTRSHLIHLAVLVLSLNLNPMESIDKLMLHSAPAGSPRLRTGDCGSIRLDTLMQRSASKLGTHRALGLDARSSPLERVVPLKACPNRLMASNPVQELTRYVCVGLIKCWKPSLLEIFLRCGAQGSSPPARSNWHCLLKAP